jgi:hypothetical protein
VGYLLRVALKLPADSNGAGPRASPAEGLLGPAGDEQMQVLQVATVRTTRPTAMVDELEQPGASAGRGR